MYYSPESLHLFAGHPHGPMEPETDDEDPTIEMIDDAMRFLASAKVAAAKGDSGRARQAIDEARMTLQELLGGE